MTTTMIILAYVANGLFLFGIVIVIGIAVWLYKATNGFKKWN